MLGSEYAEAASFPLLSMKKKLFFEVVNFLTL